MTNSRRSQCLQTIALSIGLTVVAVSSAAISVSTHRHLTRIEISTSAQELKIYVRDELAKVNNRLDDLRSQQDGQR